ncbi:hypothetical protein ACJIZ3_010456 [Penstemon smallii]|uniref:LAZY1 n=1 Tax=Penstemon smallii TaxID=265156 RepID=A0ABD3TH09_9LAMI
MKLLGWMHRKFRQNSNETPKDFSIGQQTLEDLQCYQRGNYCNKPLGKTQRDSYRRSSFTGLETAIMEEDYLDQEPSAALTELFHGFLAIGTLGTEQMANDPETPAFSFSMDHIAEKETEVTENQLKLINDELEKVLGAEVRDESCNVSSGRNSHVSTGRISHCSSITLSGKPNETAETYGSGAIICPLQSYLLGSAIGQQETAQPLKKEHRTSLGELFQKTKLAEENSGGKSERAEKSAINLMKKMLKKRMLHASSKNSTAASGGTIDSATAEKKLNKILQIFNRKVHPESSTFSQQSHKPNKNDFKNNYTHVTASKSGDILWPSADDITIYPQEAISKERSWSFKNQSHSTQFPQSSGDTSGNEFWVKSDADYLVLEL